MSSDENARDAYADIIDLPHHRAENRRHMSLYDRAAQFAAFKALSGYEDMIDESGRYTQSRPELSDYELELLDRETALLSARMENGEKPEVTVTYFVPDPFKSGGSIQSIRARIKEIDSVVRCMTLYGSDDTEDKKTDPIVISLDDITGINA